MNQRGGSNPASFFGFAFKAFGVGFSQQDVLFFQHQNSP